MIENIDNKYIQSFEYESSINSDGSVLGTCELGTATIQMINDSNTYSSLKGTWIKTIHGSFYIYDVEPVQEKVNIKLSCYDIKHKLDNSYDSSKYTFPMTLKTWRNAIFTNCGVTYDNSDFPNGDLELSEEPYIGDNPSNRQVISQIAQAGASFVITDKDDKFYFKWFKNTNYNITDWLELTTEKDSTSAINTVVLGRGDVEDNVYYPKTLPNIPKEIRIDNNYILDPQIEGETDRRYSVIEPIYNQVNGFSFVPFNIRTQEVENKLSIELGDKISYIDIWGNSLVSYVMTKKISYLGGGPSKDDNYEITLSAEEVKETSTEYSYAASVEDRLNRVEMTTDKQNKKISAVVETQNEQSEQITNLKLTTDELTGEVKSLMDVTASIDSNSYAETEDAVKGNLLYLSIKGNMSLLFPSVQTYLGSNNYFKNSDLVIEDINGNKVKIDTGIKVLNSLNGVHDEFVVDDTGSYIIRRIGVHDDLSLHVLDKEIKEKMPLVAIPLNEDYNKIYMESFPNLNYSLKYARINKYTDIFTTKVEMNSAISMNNENIDLKLEKKTDSDNIIAQINMSTEKDNDGSLIQIESDKLNIKNKKFNLASDEIEIVSPNFSVSKEGKIISIAGKIGGFEITEDKLYGTHKKNNVPYTSDDFTKIANYLLGKGTLTDEEKELYDYDKDGKVTSRDYLLLLDLVEDSTQEYTIELNSNYVDKLLNIQNEQGQILTKIGTSGSIFRKLNITEKFRFDNRENGGFLISTSTYDNSNFLDVEFPFNKSGQVAICSTTDGVITKNISLNSTGNISCVSLTQTSLETSKKNFEKIDNALDEIKKTDIYSYNLKSEDDKQKKHLGFVIGEKYNYSHLITAIDEDGKEIGVDNYSMTSLCLQAIKEQQIIIENLEQKINELEEKTHGNNN